MLGILLLFLFLLLLSWTWAQVSEDADQDSIGLTEILSTTGIEWGAILTLTLGQIRGVERFWEAPPLSAGIISARQIPIVFVPSLHTGSGIFKILIWRLQKHFFTSLWPFSWRSFLKSNDLLEDQLLKFIQDVLKTTRSSQVRVVSFGTSRPVISRVLAHPSLSDYQKKWIAISAPKTLSRTLKFLSSVRLKSVFQNDFRIGQEPNLLIRGSHDVFCYPKDVWGETQSITISPVGHYSVLLHPATVQRTLDELS